MVEAVDLDIFVQQLAYGNIVLLRPLNSGRGLRRLKGSQRPFIFDLSDTEIGLLAGGEAFIKGLCISRTAV